MKKNTRKKIIIAAVIILLCLGGVSLALFLHDNPMRVTNNSSPNGASIKFSFEF